MAKRSFKNRLKGKELITKIVELSGSSNLLNYNGNIRDIAAYSGYLAELSVGTKSTKGLFVDFIREYHSALKVSNLYQNDIHSNFEALYEELHKKYQPIPVQGKKSKNPKKLKGNELLDQIELIKDETKFSILNKCGYLELGRKGRELASINRKATASFFAAVIAAHAQLSREKYGKPNLPKNLSENYIKNKISSYKKESYKQEYIPKAFKDNVDKQLSGKYIDLCICIGHIETSGRLVHPKSTKGLRTFFKNEEAYKSRVKLRAEPIPTLDKTNKPDKPQTIKVETKKSEDNKEIVQAIRFESDLEGFELLEKVLEFHKDGKSEISICIRTGYDVDKIGKFRRAFAKAAKVKFAPLSRMLKELNEKQIISKSPSVKNEFYEINETEELFVDRERITSQVKRTYRNPKFRKKVLSKYGTVCSCCDIAIETLIEAAHIIPVENKGNDDAVNGIPLCPTHHTAFDNFLFTINPSDNSIVYKSGMSAEDLQITKSKCEINVSIESLEYRFKMFNED